MLRFFSELWSFRLVTSQLVNQNVTLRYRRTALGFLWTLINPLFTMAITTVIFSMMMRMPIRSFAVFLFTGLIPFTLFSNCITQGGGAVLENEALIKKIYIPKQVFVTSKCFSLLIDSLLSFCALFVLALVIGAHLGVSLLFLPVAFFLIFVFSYGISLIMSVVTVYYRDAQYILGIILQAAYYLTPILYPLTIVPEKFRWIFYFNPLYYFVELFRQPIYNGALPTFDIILVSTCLAVVSFVVGISIFRKYDHTLIFRL